METSTWTSFHLVACPRDVQKDSNLIAQQPAANTKHLNLDLILPKCILVFSYALKVSYKTGPNFSTRNINRCKILRTISNSLFYLLLWYVSSGTYPEVLTQTQSSFWDYRVGNTDDNILLVSQVFLTLMCYKPIF